MKNLFLSITFLMLSFCSGIAQQFLVQDAEIKIEVSPVQYTVYENSSLEIEPTLNLNQRTGSIKLNVTDGEGNIQETFEVLRFDDCGGAAYISNETEWLNFQDEESTARKQLETISEDLVCLGKARTVAEAENDATTITEIDNQIASLMVQETEIRDQAIFQPENRVNAKWVYSHTYDKLTNEYLDGYNLSAAGLQAVKDHVIYRGNELTETTMKVGPVSIFFKDPTPIAPKGDFTKDSEDCYVLGEGQTISLSDDKTYTIGRQGLCDGRTNLNGDNFTISTKGKILKTSGLTESKGIYTPITENFEIVVQGSFDMTKGTGGQFMVFAIKAR